MRARLARLVRGRRVPGLRTAKTTLAAMLSYLVADTIGTSDAPVLAPLTALPEQAYGLVRPSKEAPHASAQPAVAERRAPLEGAA